MDSLSDRIALVVRESGLTTTAFAKKINLSQTSISKLMNGKQNPSDRTIIDIAATFGVNEDWLRTGEGPMRPEKTRAEEIATFLGELVDAPPSFKQRLVSVLASLSEDQWELLEDMANKLAAEAAGEKEKPGQGPGEEGEGVNGTPV